MYVPFERETRGSVRDVGSAAFPGSYREKSHVGQSHRRPITSAITPEHTCIGLVRAKCQTLMK